MSPGEKMLWAIAYHNALVKVRAEDAAIAATGAPVDTQGQPARAALEASRELDDLGTAHKHLNAEYERLCNTPRHEWTPAKRLRLDQVKTALARLEAISEG